jgi:PQQ-like domain
VRKVAGLFALVAAILPPTSARAATQVNWPVRGFSPAHTGFNSEESTIGRSNVAALKAVQHLVLPSGTSTMSPVLSGGMLFIAGTTQQLFAFRLSDCASAPCAPVWTGSPASFGSGGIAVGGGFVFTVGFADFALHAFAVAGCGSATCSPVWSAHVGASAGPVVSGSTVFVTGGQSLYSFPVAGCGSATCTPTWSGGIGGGGDCAVPAVSGGVVYAVGTPGSTCGGLSAFTAAGCSQATCPPLWTGSTTGNFTTDPVVAAGKVYIGSSDPGLSVYDANGCGTATCAPTATSAIGPFAKALVVAQGTAYLASKVTSTWRVMAFTCSGSTCSSTWASDETTDAVSGLAVANGVVYAGRTGFMQAFPTGSCQNPCQPLWASAQPNATGGGWPIVLRGSMFSLTSSSHEVTAFAPPPDTKITQSVIHPAQHTATFRFSAVGAASGFQCALKKGSHQPVFSSCASPSTYAHLAPGGYTFLVRALSHAGHDPTPATKAFDI